MILKKYLALCFMIFFMLINSAPTIIMSMDDSIDSSILLDRGEEEEKEDIKLLFEITSEEWDDTSLDRFNIDIVGYTSKKYLKPHLNLIFPPPERRLA